MYNKKKKKVVSITWSLDGLHPGGTAQCTIYNIRYIVFHNILSIALKPDAVAAGI